VSLVNSDLTVALSRSAGFPGDVDILGTLWEAGQLVIIPNATIDLYVNGTYQGSVTTDAYGHYIFTYDFPEGSFDIYTSWDGNATYLSDVSPLVQGTYAKVQAAISMTVSPPEGAPPLQVTLSGYLSRSDTGAGLVGKTVFLNKDGVDIKNMVTQAAGYYEFSDIIDETSSYYVEFKGDDMYHGCEEDELSLPCTICGHPIPVDVEGSELVCPTCHSVFETVIV